MSNVPALQITPTGVTVPQSVDIRTGILADTNDAFGGDLDVVTPSTPQAYLADNLTQNIVDVNSQIAYIVNQVDPATSEGRFQDAIARIYFINRLGATSSVVTVQLTGQSQVNMPAGQLMQDDAGLLWQSDGDVQFPLGGGTVDVQFTCQTPGPVQLGIGALTKIAKTFNGWDAGVNLSPATIGSSIESRRSFEDRRRESVANGGRGSPSAIRASVWGVPGVIDVFTYDNYTNAPINYGSTNYELAPHSIYVGVVGGNDQAIAEAIWATKDTGCDMNGNTSVTIADSEGYTYPYPEYTIKFNRPYSLPIKFRVEIANNSALPANIEQLTKSAIINAFTGAGSANRPRIGGAIFASNYYAPIVEISTAISIIQIKIGTTTANLDSLIAGIDQSPVVQESDIEVILR